MFCRVPEDSLDETSQRGTNCWQGPSSGARGDKEAYRDIRDLQVRLDRWHRYPTCFILAPNAVWYQKYNRQSRAIRETSQPLAVTVVLLFSLSSFPRGASAFRRSRLGAYRPPPPPSRGFRAAFHRRRILLPSKWRCGSPASFPHHLGRADHAGIAVESNM